ncbi:TPA: YoaK family small membrane protein [Klebsiella pneumoniae]
MRNVLISPVIVFIFAVAFLAWFIFGGYANPRACKDS